MTLLSVVQNASRESGFPVHTTVVANTDDGVQQMYALANRVGKTLMKEFAWQALLTEDYITLATGDQDYALASDFDRFLSETTYDRTNSRSVVNPLSSQEWQFLKGYNSVTGLNLRSRLRNNQLEFEQTIGTGENGSTIYYEYVSKNWVLDESDNPKSSYTVDTDVARIPEDLITLGVAYKYRLSKGLEWESYFADYMSLKLTVMNNDKPARILKMSGNDFHEVGLVVPDRGYG